MAVFTRECEVLQPNHAIRAHRQHNFGWPWITLCFAFALHVIDETLTGFLNVYNPTAVEIRRRIRIPFPPTFGETEPVVGLFVVIAVLAALSPLAFRGSRGVRPLAYVYGVIMVLNACSHTAGTIMGRGLFPDIVFPRPMPGFWSSPFLFAAAIWLLAALRRTRAGMSDLGNFSRAAGSE